VLTVRDFRPEDFEPLWQLDQRCFVAGISYSRLELRYYVDRKTAFTILAEHQKKLLGFLIADRDRRGFGHIITIDVEPTEHRKGIGTLLMNAAEHRLERAGCKSVLLETAVDNLSALSFYKRHGYSVIRTLPRYYLNSLDGLLMGKRIVSNESSSSQRTSDSKR
jgi:[ribosomal protein S18]-alanine N-acetyltransferase